MPALADVYRDPTFLGALRQAGYLQPLDLSNDAIQKRLVKGLEKVAFRTEVDEFLQSEGSVHYGELEGVCDDNGDITVIVPVRPLPRRKPFVTASGAVWNPLSDSNSNSVTFTLSTGKKNFPIFVKFLDATPSRGLVAEFAVGVTTKDHTLVKVGRAPIRLDGGNRWASTTALGVFAAGKKVYKIYLRSSVNWKNAQTSWEASKRAKLPMVPSDWHTVAWKLRTGGKLSDVVYLRTDLIEGAVFFGLNEPSKKAFYSYVQDRKSVSTLAELLRAMSIAWSLHLSNSQGFLGRNLASTAGPSHIIFLNMHAHHSTTVHPEVTVAIIAIVKRLQIVDSKWKTKVNAAVMATIQRTFPFGIPGDVRPVATKTAPRMGSLDGYS